MSGNGTEYTLTPNLGLYKPIANMAVGLWGDLWNSNADAIDSAIHASTGGGPYLPLAGNATVFGATTFSAPLIYTATGGTTARAAQDRAHDFLNVKDFGALLDGTTNDVAAFQATTNAALSDQIIRVPYGGFNLPTAVTRASGNVLWQLDGNKFGTGTTPVVFTGSSGDVTETFVQGRKSFKKQVTSAQSIAVVEVNLDYQWPTAPSNAVSAGLHVICTPGVTTGNTFVWGINSELNSATNGTNQHLAGAFTTRKAGTAPCFALFAQMLDNTGSPSSVSGGAVTCEFDLFANGLDDAPLGARNVLGVIYGRSDRTGSGTDMSVHKALTIGPQPVEVAHASADIMINLYGTFNQSGLDSRPATQGPSANAIWLGDNHTIALNKAGTSQLGYITTGTARLRYMAGANEVWSVSDPGAMTIGTTLGSTSRPGFLVFNTYRGDATHPWFTGGNWCFGWNPTTVGGAAIRPLLVQRDAAYTGALSGSNPGALQVTNNVSAGVTGMESALIATVNTSATAGLSVAGTFNVAKNAAGSGTIAVNVVADDGSARKSSIGGPNVVMEIDANASGPDDGSLRINTEMTFKESPIGGASSDGATTFAYGAVRCRGAALNFAGSGTVAVPATATYAFAATTINAALNTGFVGGFTTPFLADGCSGAAYSAVSAIQVLPTSAAFSAGVTTITLTNPLATASYVWPGALATGTNIPAGTRVASSTYNSSTQLTTVVFDRTIGALTSGQNITFANAIGTGFQAGGYLTTAAFTSPGFNVSPTGAVTMQAAGFNGTAPVAKPAVTGAKGSNAALASLVTALAAYGLITDSTSA